MATRTPTRLSPPTRPTLAALYTGLALSLLAALALLVDHYAANLLASHVHDVYAGYVQVSATPIFGYLLTVGALGTVAWLGTTWAVMRRKRWARAVATTAFVLGSSVALVNLVVQEYGSPLLPTLFGVLGVLPSLAGLVAVVLLWTRGRRPTRNEGNERDA